MKEYNEILIKNGEAERHLKGMIENGLTREEFKSLRRMNPDLWERFECMISKQLHINTNEIA